MTETPLQESLKVTEKMPMDETIKRLIALAVHADNESHFSAEGTDTYKEEWRRDGIAIRTALDALTWRPVETLPPNDEPVLATVDTAYNHERRMRFVQIQSYCEGEWETQDVTAWGPVPSPTTFDISLWPTLTS